MKDSEFLRVIADEYLWDGLNGHTFDLPPGKSQFICHALADASGINWQSERRGDVYELRAAKLMVEMGLPIHSAESFLFEDNSAPFGTRSMLNRATQQQLRYAFLMFAADYSQELGR